MNENSDFVYLSRDLIGSAIGKNPKALSLYIHIIVGVNHEPERINCFEDRTSPDDEPYGIIVTKIIDRGEMMAVPSRIMREIGIENKDDYNEALRMLVEYGLIEINRRNGMTIYKAVNGKYFKFKDE